MWILSSTTSEQSNTNQQISYQRNFKSSWEYGKECWWEHLSNSACTTLNGSAQATSLSWEMEVEIHVVQVKESFTSNLSDGQLRDLGEYDASQLVEQWSTSTGGTIANQKRERYCKSQITRRRGGHVIYHRLEEDRDLDIEQLACKSFVFVLFVKNTHLRAHY